jgi:glycosyltransferase involved in cell wall biosynthesis
VKVLMVHNYYQQAGGEDTVFLAEQDSLRRQGVEVRTFTVDNDSIGGQSNLKTAVQTVWNARMARQLADLVTEHGSDVVHFHNTFPLVSPAAYWAVRARGAAVVQTLHNFRLLCAGATLYREQDEPGGRVGRVCEDCLGKLLPLPAVQHACYRGSRAGSAVVASMQVAHRLLGSYSRAVDQYIALDESGRQKMIQGGLPADRLSVKPNFLVHDPGLGTGDGHYALFVGRLTPEKGVLTLLDAWAELGHRLPLKVAGDGPLLAEIQRRAAGLPNVEVLGWQDAGGVGRLMSGATLLVFPSEWYETFGMVLLEAYARGLPVVASDIGALSSLVQDGVTGHRFRPGDPADLARTVSELMAQPDKLAEMRQAARQMYLGHYTAEINAQQQLDVYARALAQRGRRPGSLPNAGEPPQQRATQP